MNRFALLGALSLASFGGIALGLVEPDDTYAQPRPKVVKLTNKPEAIPPCETFGSRQRRRFEQRKGRR